MDILSSLLEYGLSSNEARIYTFLLNTVESPVYNISKEVKIPRTTTYSTLELLKNQGLVSSFKKNGVLFYTPSNPKKLIQLLKNKEALINDIMPGLQALIDKQEGKPGVRLFMAKEGMKVVYEDILDTCRKDNIKELYVAGHPDMPTSLPRYFPQWVERRMALGIFTRLIAPASTKGNLSFYGGHFRETRFLPPDFPFQCSMDIYGDKVAFFSLKGNQIYSVIIESPTITEMFKQFFLFTWEMLGRQHTSNPA